MLFGLLFTSVFLAGIARCEVFTSVYDLAQMFDVERKIADALDNYVAKTEAKLEKIRSYLRNYEQVRAELKGVEPASLAPSTQASERLTGNPIHTYHLMKRLTVYWKHIDSHDPVADWETVKEAIVKGAAQGLSNVTEKEDLLGSAEAIIRLQKIYQLNTAELVRGKILGLQTAAELSAEDCLYFGQTSFEAKNYVSAMDWLDEAYKLAGFEKNKRVTEDSVIPLLNDAIKQHLASDKHSLNTTAENDVDKAEIHSKLKHLEAIKSAVEIRHNLTDKISKFEALCRGEQLLSRAYVATLKCFYDTRTSSHLLLMPAKVETFLHRPPVVLFHDVIREKDIQKMKQLATPTVTFLTAADENKFFGRLNVLIEHLTGLVSKPVLGGGERLQVANYGAGAHYSAHTDYLFADKSHEQLAKMNKSPLIEGDRLATFMFYLSDVTRGGATVFPHLNVAVFPVKGSAIFWYNLKKSGAGNTQTLHGACPVVYGSKWVSNKWIRDLLQFQRSPCGLTENE